MEIEESASVAYVLERYFKKVNDKLATVSLLITTVYDGCTCHK